MRQGGAAQSPSRSPGVWQILGWCIPTFGVYRLTLTPWEGGSVGAEPGGAPLIPHLGVSPCPCICSLQGGHSREKNVVMWELSFCFPASWYFLVVESTKAEEIKERNFE